MIKLTWGPTIPSVIAQQAALVLELRRQGDHLGEGLASAEEALASERLRSSQLVSELAFKDTKITDLGEAAQRNLEDLSAQVGCDQACIKIIFPVHILWNWN